MKRRPIWRNGTAHHPKGVGIQGRFVHDRGSGGSRVMGRVCHCKACPPFPIWEKRYFSGCGIARPKSLFSRRRLSVYLSCKTSSFAFSESESHSSRTVVIPRPTMPRAFAAARETSMMRPLPKGPRSLIRTSTDCPLSRLMTFTLLPQGRVG